MNNENLKPFNRRTESEQREIATKGGKASGEARNFAKSIRSALEAELIKADGNNNQYEQMACSIVAKAIKGDVQAAAFVAKILGEDITRITADANNVCVYLTIPSDWNKEQRERWTQEVTKTTRGVQIIWLTDYGI